jgi:cytochrome b involved in lipid metabolism
MSPSLLVFVAAALLVGCANAFTRPSVFHAGNNKVVGRMLVPCFATTLEPTTTTTKKNGVAAPTSSTTRPNGVDAATTAETAASRKTADVTTAPVAAESSAAKKAPTTITTTALDVRIHDIWYDLSKWRMAHPAGSHWIDYYNGRDATEVMDAFHSVKARQMYQRLPHSKQVPENVPAVSATQRAFRALQVQLEEEGYWERDMVHEITQLSLWASCVIGAVFFAQSGISGMFHNDILAVSLLGMSMTAAGWLGHDYIHGVDNFANRMRNFAALAAGLTPTWWSDKHNKVR